MFIKELFYRYLLGERSFMRIRRNRTVCIVLAGLFFFPLFTPMISSITLDSSHANIENHASDLLEKHRFPEGYPKKSFSSEPSESTVVQNPAKKETTNQVTFKGGPMESPWPMYSHDIRHTGFSPYSTADNPLVEKWKFQLSWVSSYAGFIIDNNNTIYGGSAYIYAITSNGTMKWAYPTWDTIESAPAIDQNGIIYVGTIWGMPNYLHAIYSNNGTLKWKYSVGSNDIDSSPAIAPDGTIYFGDWASYVHSVYPNGTRKWIYDTGDVITSSPAIGNDGIIYIGSHDNYVYAFYPNGTVKWRFKTGSWVHASPTIAPDGTIYIGSDDGYLYALNSVNGSMIWRCSVGAIWGSPTLGIDGVIYAGVWEMKFYAIYPNGTIKWTYNAPGRIWFGSSATVSSDGTIFFGTTTMDGGSGALIALNPNGTERFRDNYGYYATSPAIGEDGTVYAASFDNEAMNGQLHAFGKGPLKVEANGPYSGKAGNPVQLTGTIYGGIPPYTHHWDFSDGNTSDEQNPTHIYTNVGNFTVTFSVTDSEGNHSTDSSYAIITAAPPSLTITKPVNGFYFINKQLFPFPKPFIIGPITIQAEANQVPYGIDRVEFYIDDTLKATVTETPYQWTWTTPTFFKHTIKVIAHDTSGKNTTTSLVVSKFF
jgi:outer membrane protein assembly factor BamB